MAALALLAGLIVIPATPARAEAGDTSHLRVGLRYRDGTLSVERLEAAAPALRRQSRPRPGGWQVEARGRRGELLAASAIADPRSLAADWPTTPPLGALAGETRRRDDARFDVLLAAPPSSVARIVVLDGNGAGIASLLVVPPPPARPGPSGPPGPSLDPRCPDGWPSVTVKRAGPAENRLNLTILGDGYRADELDRYAADVAVLVDRLTAEEPFREYSRFLNVHRVDVVSPESGTDEPDRGIERDTELGCGFGWGGIDRCLYCDEQPVLEAAGCAPATDQVIVLVNSARYGGCGGGSGFSAIAGGNGDAVAITLHELGHSLAGVADEYGGHRTWSGPEHPRPNCSALGPEQMTVRRTKWWAWLGGPGITTERGCAGFDEGLHRPAHSCAMRSLGQPLCPVCREQHVLALHERVDPIDGAFPPADPVVAQHEGLELGIERVAPASHAHEVTWYLDGRAVAAGVDRLRIAPHSLPVGTHVVEVVVRDPTDLVRSDPWQLLRSQRRWTVTVTCRDGGTDLDRDADGWCGAEGGGRDCDDANPAAWARPGEVEALEWLGDGVTLRWNAPAQAGANPERVTYDVLRGSVEGRARTVRCLGSNLHVRSLSDLERPAAGGLFVYLARAQNECPDGLGPAGTGADGERRVPDCPLFDGAGLPERHAPSAPADVDARDRRPTVPRARQPRLHRAAVHAP